MLKFGEMMIELDNYVDNSFVFDDAGDIVARHPGMKGFLSEHCPHIGYKTAMRYRILAMKVRSAAQGREKTNDVFRECRKRTLRELSEKLDAHLEIKHRQLTFRHRRRHRCNSNAIFDMREWAFSVIKQLPGARRRYFASALLELAKELPVS